MRFLKLIFLLVAVMVISKPIMLSAQMAPSQDACMQAKMDAHKDVNGCLWFGAGTLLGFPWGWPILPMIITPSPPATRLIGVSPDYVAYYTQCYKEESKDIQSLKALGGAILNTGIIEIFWLIMFERALLSL